MTPGCENFTDAVANTIIGQATNWYKNAGSPQWPGGPVPWAYYHITTWASKQPPIECFDGNYELRGTKTPPPPPPPGACSYVSGTNNVYTAGCIATSTCVAQPDGTFVGSTCSATAAVTGCAPNATTLCLDDQPGDKRFQVSVSYETSQGGGGFGAGQAIPTNSLGVNQGGMFWLFSPTNPEVLVKVLNACSINDHVWVFASGTTNVGLSIAVLDSKTHFQNIYTNSDVHAMDTIQDTTTFPCQ